MRSIVLALVLIFGLAASFKVAPGSSENQFLAFQRKFNKVYYSQNEFNYRLEVFKSNLVRATKLQAEEKPTNGATFGVTKFMDLTPEEFASFYLMPNVDFSTYEHKAPVKTVFSDAQIRSLGYSPNAVNFDWSQQSPAVTTPVYNQGQCGSCWAFSATETIESYYALSGSSITQLSMEQIVDCDVNGPDSCCDQCNGGFPYAAYDYIQQAGGIDSYNSYPYTAEGGQPNANCSFSSSNVVTTVSGYQSLSGESGLYSQLSTGGPVSVCVDASSWQYYNGGVLTSCGNTVDHCVQATGYGNWGGNGGTAYWIVRNSWGTDWGINGFIWVEAGQNMCAIGSSPTIVNI